MRLHCSFTVRSSSFNLRVNSINLDALRPPGHSVATDVHKRSYCIVIVGYALRAGYVTSMLVAACLLLLQTA